MRKSRFTEEQISRNTFYSWKKKYGGMDVSDARRLKKLEDENRRLEKLVADQALDVQMLKEVLSRKRWGPRRAAGRGPSAASV